MTNIVRRAAMVLCFAVVASACNISPLNRRIKVGEEPIVVFVGEGIDGNTDLFVVPASGGSIAQLTFTPLRESMPRLNVRGDVIAFLRVRDTASTAPNEVVIMNLLNGAERALALPDGAGRAAAIAWAPDTNSLYVRTATGSWRIPTPPAPPSAVAAIGDELAAADSLIELWVGHPRFAQIIPCATAGVCVVGASNDTSILSPLGKDPLRWGADSVAWFEGDGMVIRGIGPGTVRRMLWKRPPAHPRDGSYSGAITPET